MPYEVPRNLPQTEFKGGKTILASVHFDYTREGGTVDGAAVGNRYVELGEPFVQRTTDFKYVPYTDAAHLDAETGQLKDGFQDPVICDVDFNSSGDVDIVVGALLISGTVYSAKLPDKVTPAFKKLTGPLMRYEQRGL